MTKQLSIVIAVLGFLLVTVSACDDGVSNGTDDGVSNGTDAYYAKKLELLRQAANQGEAFAQSNLGAMYKDGQGVSQDYAEAVKWYRLAAEQGDAVAQLTLGAMYFAGLRVPKDYDEAVKWFRLAAEQGNANAQRNLGLMYATGTSFIRNDLFAYVLFHLASAQDFEGAKEHRESIAKGMTSAAISRAQDMARNFPIINYSTSLNRGRLCEGSRAC